MYHKEPVSGLPLLVYKLRTEGFSWLFDRLRREWQMPTTRPGRRLSHMGRWLRFWGRSDMLAVPRTPSDTLYAFYDLGVAPITFDFLWYLSGAEIMRRRRGLSRIHVVIVPGPVKGLRKERADYDHVIDAAARRARIDDILVPACRLLPSVAGVTVATSREQAAALCTGAEGRVFPTDYLPGAPMFSGAPFCLAAAREGEEVGVLQATASDLRVVEEWLAVHCRRGGRVVTITLRAYGYMPARDSNLAAWIAFARRLDPARFSVVFVPDTYQARGTLPPELAGMTVYTNAALDVGLRMALYERAYLNLGINSGPMGLCWLNRRTRYITFKQLTPGVPQATPEYIASHGFELGYSLPFAHEGQRWVWENDELPVVEREFSDMVRRIEKEPREKVQ